MIYAYSPGPGGLSRLDQGRPLAEALWIDLYRPLDAQVREVEALGIAVPTLADMEEIEISNRLYREGAYDVMTVVLPGQAPDGTRIEGPVSFILAENRLVTVRHHAPRPFETYPARANSGVAGCSTPERIFLGLFEEIISRLADLLEGAGREVTVATAAVFGGGGANSPAGLQHALELVGRQGETVGRVRLSLLTMERALSFYSQHLGAGASGEGLKAVVKGEMRDIQALAVHADFLSSRVALAVDATLGMINLAQNATVRILSVVAALFLPPTLIASIYGMNFAVMPELTKSWGYPVSLILMLASSGATYLFFRWKKWL